MTIWGMGGWPTAGSVPEEQSLDGPQPWSQTHTSGARQEEWSPSQFGQSGTSHDGQPAPFHEIVAVIRVGTRYHHPPL